ncbi:MAG: glycoside hydrolase family 28 protein [Saprospiraceae bacterium]|nr:glycoside hydrolase family 28 protein [Saprospiraceae bacterium]
MHSISLLFLLLLLNGCGIPASTETSTDPWSTMDSILEQISRPAFPDQVYFVQDFGATTDGKEDARKAFTEAIKKCSSEGGGTVVAPAGDYLINGSIYLESNVNLRLEEGAYLRFSVDPAHYLPVVHTRWEGIELMNYSPLIYAFEEENIAITGHGTIDGQASEKNWWPWKGLADYGWKPGMPLQESEESKYRLIRLNEDRAPVDERIFGSGTYLRPNLIQPNRCTNILIEGITIKNSPMWVIHPLLCENVIIQDVKVISHGPNSDGCDPESCKNVLIDGCYFDTGDDCIALKSGRNQDGREINRPIENVVIRNCQMKDGHGGVVIGSEVSGGARNIFATDCQMDSPNLERAIRIKTNKVRGGTLENLFFRNLKVGQVSEAVVKINANYTIDTKTELEFIPVIRNIYIDQINSSKSKYGILIDGYDATHPVNNVHITNCRFEGVGEGNLIENVSDLTTSDIVINGVNWSWNN